MIDFRQDLWAAAFAVLLSCEAVAQVRTGEIGAGTLPFRCGRGTLRRARQERGGRGGRSCECRQVTRPYATKGIAGGTIELTYVDEAGGTTKQVTEYRNLVQRQDVDW